MNNDVEELPRPDANDFSCWSALKQLFLSRAQEDWDQEFPGVI